MRLIGIAMLGAALTLSVPAEAYYLGAPDAKMFRERPWLSHVQKAWNIADELFELGNRLGIGHFGVLFHIFSSFVG